MGHPPEQLAGSAVSRSRHFRNCHSISFPPFSPETVFCFGWGVGTPLASNIQHIYTMAAGGNAFRYAYDSTHNITLHSMIDSANDNDGSYNMKDIYIRGVHYFTLATTMSNES